MDSIKELAKISHKYLQIKSDLRKLAEKMEIVATDEDWEDLDDGYRTATADWADEIKKLL